MRAKHSLPAGTFHVTMHAYCGMAYDIGDRGMTEVQARDTVRRFCAKRTRQGYTVAQLVAEDWQECEISEPEDSAMIPDDAGVIRVVEDTVPAAECWNCGEIVAIGECCSCQESINDDMEDAHA